jgi:hypothetical protein
MQKVAPNERGCHAHMGSFHLPMGPSNNPIDRISVSQHETALLISGSIPILIGRQ